MKTGKKIVLFANTDWYLYNFRQSLAEQYRKNGLYVVLVSPPGEYGDELSRLGYRWIPLQFSTRSVNPLRELIVLWRVFMLYWREKPDMVHHFTIKCALYGSIVARVLGGIKILNSITGMGHVFTDPGLRSRIIATFVKFLYRMVLTSKDTKVTFQNSEDRDFFVDHHLVRDDQTSVIRGSGVDCKKFKPAKVKRVFSRPVRALFASRMIKEKGVMELVEAAKLLQKRRVDVEFVFAGDIYPENPSSLTKAELDNIAKSGLIQYLGHIKDMPALLASVDMVVLPSYREGSPKILLEAAASGKPIVATNIAGCRGIVCPQQNGILVPVRDVEALANAIQLLAQDPAMRVTFGRNGRRIAVCQFDQNIINEALVNVVREFNLTCSTKSARIPHQKAS